MQCRSSSVHATWQLEDLLHQQRQPRVNNLYQNSCKAMLALPCWLHQHFLMLIQTQIFKTKQKKNRGLLPIKCFWQVYGSTYSTHNIGGSWWALTNGRSQLGLYLCWNLYVSSCNAFLRIVSSCSAQKRTKKILKSVHCPSRKLYHVLSILSFSGFPWSSQLLTFFFSSSKTLYKLRSPPGSFSSSLGLLLSAIHR